MSHREAVVTRGCDHRLHLGVVFDRAVARERVFEAHLHIDAELQHHVDELECTSGPVGMQVDDRRPERVLRIDLRHDFRGPLVAQ